MHFVSAGDLLHFPRGDKLSDFKSFLLTGCSMLDSRLVRSEGALLYKKFMLAL